MLTRTTRTTCLALLCAALLSGPARADSERAMDIAAGDLATALQRLAQQAGIELIYSVDQIKGLRTEGVHGRYTSEIALHKLLEGTNLRVTVHSSGAMLIAPPSPPPADTGGRQSDPGASEQVNLVQSNEQPAPRADDGARIAATQEPATLNGRVLEEVIITGSHIRGVRNETSPVVSLDQTYIERSGYTTMAQLVQSLPMNFAGGFSGASETAAFGNSAAAGQNLNRGTGLNIHGLGSLSTLTLINGHRVAPAAEGQFVDISNIPLTAVDRVEILTDGASAIYGADAVGGVVNIILRKNFEGAESQVSAGMATRGDNSSLRLSQTLGRSWSGGNALLVAQFTKRDPLDARDRDFIVNAGGASPDGPTYLLPKRNDKTLVFNINQSLPEHFDLTGNLIYSHERVRQENTDFTANLENNSPVTDQWSAMVGLGYQPFGDWRFELDANASQMKTLTDFTDIDLPSQQITLLIDNYRDKFELWMADFKADGSLFEIPSGKVRLAVGGSYRHDKSHADRDWVIPARGYQLHANDSRSVRSAYAELFVPVLSREQSVPFARRIDLSLAARYDDYSDFGNTTNPKVGLVWTPVDGVDIRASYGKSFRAPTVYEKSLFTRGLEIDNTTITGLDGNQVPIFYLVGSAPLTAEKSRNFSVGTTLKSERLPGAELSATYFNINYSGRISVPPFDDGMLFERGVYGSLITEIPNDAAAQAYLDAALAKGATFRDQTGSGATGVRYVFDWRQQNAATSKIDGIDVTGLYEFQYANNTYDFNVSYSRLNKIRTTLLPDTAPIDVVNTYEQPLKNRVRAMGTWLRGGFTSTTAVNFSNSYVNASVLPRERIKAWTTIDLNLAYDFSHLQPSGPLNGFRVAFNISNLFDVNPPYATDPFYSMGFDVFNADAVGRYTTLQLSKRW
jgi:iron complex outermembrane receptor protein